MKCQLAVITSFCAALSMVAIAAIGVAEVRHGNPSSSCAPPPQCLSQMEISNVVLECEELTAQTQSFEEKGRSIVVNRSRGKLAAHVFGPDYGDGSVPFWKKIGLSRAGKYKRSFRGVKFAMHYKSELKRRKPELSVFSVKSPIFGGESSVGFVCRADTKGVLVTVNNMVACPAFCYGLD